MTHVCLLIKKTVTLQTFVNVDEPFWMSGEYVDGLVQETRNSSALAMELRLSCTNPSLYD